MDELILELLYLVALLRAVVELARDLVALGRDLGIDVPRNKNEEGR